MFIAINIIGFFISLYLFWKRLKEDYIANQIFSTAFFSVIGLIIFYLISSKFFSDWWFWATSAGAVVGLSIGVWKYKLKYFETFEAASLGYLIWLSLYFLNDAVTHSNLPSFIGFVTIVILVGLYHFFDNHYKSFIWYRSGKVGFSGLATSTLFFLLRTIVFIFSPHVLSFVPKFEIYLSALASFLFAFLTYNLSRETP
jgi:hypothetical protein